MTPSTNAHRVPKILACVGILSIASLVYAFATGPLPGFTGAPGESNCTECHDSFGEAPNEGNGSVDIVAPSRYELGERVTLTVSVSQPGQRRWGFELTALSVNDDSPAGQFVITDSLRTRLTPGENGRFYVEHTSPGTFRGQPSGASWSFDWIAPTSDVGPVAFYAAGNAANGDGTRLGDWIYTSVTTASPPSFPVVKLLSPNGSEVLCAGGTTTIQWEADQADSFDILFFPRPGSLPQTIASGIPADCQSFDWTVPDVVTDSATVGVIAFNSAGFGIDESESPFLIVECSSPLVEVVSPAGLQAVKGGAGLSIQWNVDQDAVILDQQIYLSTDGGQSFPLVLAASLPANARRFEWTVPTTVQTNAARVLVLVRFSDGNMAANRNDQDFVIFNPRVSPATLSDAEIVVRTP